MNPSHCGDNAPSTEASREEEKSRTIYVTDLDQAITPEQMLQLFSSVGEVKYVRMAGDQTLPLRSAFVEFSDKVSVPLALALTGTVLGKHPIK
jgi:arginine/serine-rich splicing factor 12